MLTIDFCYSGIAFMDRIAHSVVRRFFERVLLLIRNIANPSEEDEYFPTWRHKDWYQGHSWASGIAMPYLNGKNQESSSESIAAYEAVAVYGGVMVRSLDLCFVTLL